MPPSFQETLQDQQVGLAQAPITLLLLPRFAWDFVSPLRVESLVSLVSRGSSVKPHRFFKSQIFGGLLFPVLDRWGSGA